MNDKSIQKILFIGCNFDQIPYLEEIKNRSFFIVGIDKNTDAPGKAKCDVFYNISYDEIDALIRIGQIEKFGPDDKVFTAAAQFAHKGAAYFAEFFNIPYVSRKTVELCLDKAAYYEYFNKNNIPIPKTWFLKNEHELKKLISSMVESKWYYLKSDYSKNPNYVYRIHSSNVPYETIFWGRDRYFEELYILQEEFAGVSLRLNLYGDHFNVFDFNTQEKTNRYHDKLKSFHIIDTLRNFMLNQGLQNWLIKFDIILNEKEYVVLDIGMDPPFRMNKDALNNGINFAKHYLDQFLDNNISYPKSLS
jgi:hypothetical protein